MLLASSSADGKDFLEAKQSVEADLSPSQVREVRDWAKHWKPVTAESSKDSLSRGVTEADREAGSQAGRPEPKSNFAAWYGYGYTVGRLVNEIGATFNKKPTEGDLWDYLAKHDSIGPNARGGVFSARIKDEDVEACKQGYTDSIGGQKARYTPTDRLPPLR